MKIKINISRTSVNHQNPQCKLLRETIYMFLCINNSIVLWLFFRSVMIEMFQKIENKYSWIKLWYFKRRPCHSSNKENVEKEILFSFCRLNSQPISLTLIQRRTSKICEKSIVEIQSFVNMSTICGVTTNLLMFKRILHITSWWSRFTLFHHISRVTHYKEVHES